MNARTAAVARENQQIEESQGRAIAAREAEQMRPRNALEAMAARLQVSPAGLKDTLMNTVFSACRTDAEFIALTIVANTYNLNPLTKEIYAFPKKGGGIQAMVGYDGWIRIMNDHPQFDGIEFDHTLDKNGNIVAVEGIIHRKDRSRPTKKIVYLKEFKKNTEPWNVSPSHMLDVRCLCHTVRLAFGINAGVEGDLDDAPTIDGGSLTAQSLPSRQTLAEELGDEIPTNFDKQTGEIIEQRGMTEVDEETARELDARTGNDGTLSDDNPTAAEGPSDEDRGEGHAEPAWAGKVAEIKTGIAGAKTSASLKAIESEYVKHAVSLPNDVASEIEDLLRAKKNALSKEG